MFHTLVANSPFTNFDSSSLSGVFFFLPPIVCLWTFLLDRWSYFRPSAFRSNAAIPGIDGQFFWLSTFAFAACWIPLLICCYRARSCIKRTQDSLLDYRRTVEALAALP